jgi:hypothetical protein
MRVGHVLVGVAISMALLGAGRATAAEPAKIPVSMIVDDPAPFINPRSVKDATVCREIPTSFYLEFGRWAEKAKVKGKFSVVPCIGGVKPIDGSLGEYPGHSRRQRLEWIEMIRTLYAPRFTLTPEVITHWYVWDLDSKRLMPGPPTENDWLAAQPLSVQVRYIAEAMQMLKNVGIEAGGLTMCWSYPKEKNHVLGEAVLRAAEKVYGLKYVMIFNDTGDRPAVIYRRDDGAMAVSIRPAVADVYEHTFGRKTEQDILRDTDQFISPDGRSGRFVEQIKKGSCLVFYTHIQSLYGNGTKSGLKVFQTAVERLESHYGDRIEWMTGLDLCRKLCPPGRKP